MRELDALLLETNLFTPKTKPLGDTIVDESHPLADGLLQFFVCNESGGPVYDVAGSYLAENISGNAHPVMVIDPVEGPVLDTDGNTDGLTFSNEFVNYTDTYTLIVRMMARSTAGYPMVFCGDAFNSGGQMLMLRGTGEIFHAASGDWTSLTMNDFALDVWQTHIIRRANTYVEYLIDGVVQSAKDVPGLVADLGIRHLTGDADDRFDGLFSYAVGWAGRYLDDAELDMFSASPYALLRPLPRSIWSTTPDIGGLISVTSQGNLYVTHNKEEVFEDGFRIGNLESVEESFSPGVVFNMMLSSGTPVTSFYRNIITEVANVLSSYSCVLGNEDLFSTISTASLGLDDLRDVLHTATTGNTGSHSIQHPGKLSVDAHLSLLWLGSLKTDSDLTADVLFKDGITQDTLHKITVSSEVLQDAFVGVGHSEMLHRDSESVISFKHLLGAISNLPLLYSGGLGVSSDTSLPICFRAIEKALSSLAINTYSGVKSGLTQDVQYKQTLDCAEELAAEYRQLLSRIEDIKLIWEGGIRVDSLTELPITFKGNISASHNIDTSTSSIVATLVDTSAVFKQRVEIPINEAINFLSSVGVCEDIINNFSSIIIVNDSASIRWSNKQDFFYVDGDAEMWVLNERGTVWRLF